MFEMSCLKDHLLYTIPSHQHSKEILTELLTQHPEIKFVSLVGVDLGGNDTDEKVPIRLFLEDMDEFLGGGIQTDGSSVILPGLVTLNNGKLDLVADPSVNWFIDYNFEHIDPCTQLPVGTLRIPSFLVHDGKRVDSRSILQRAIEHFQKEMKKILEEHPSICQQLGFSPQEIDRIILTAATELEFWVKTPREKADVEELSTSQVLQEQYWKRTKGVVRTALEKSLLMLDKYGLEPEMGHKEVGGVKAQIDGAGHLDHIAEQLEIDWKYADALQAADNELIARITTKEIFRLHGLEVTFMAKPIEGVAGSGEHTHVGVAVKTQSGKKINLFSPARPDQDYLDSIGWGALMGILKHYEIISPFISSSIDALNRLKPGFEAPACIVASIGHQIDIPSRNRTVLVGLVRDLANPLAARFEVRSPNPHSNTYLTLAALYQAMLHGIKAAVASGMTSKELEEDFSKPAGQPSFYLEKDRCYRSEEDVFEHYSPEERNRLFGNPPGTVWENLCALSKYPEKTATLFEGQVFNQRLVDSFFAAVRNNWTAALLKRTIPENMKLIRDCKPLHREEEYNDVDEKMWQRINGLRRYLMKDDIESPSLFSRIRHAILNQDYDQASTLQREMMDRIDELKTLYAQYRGNIIDLPGFDDIHQSHENH